MSCPQCGKDHEYTPPASIDDVSMESIQREVELGHMPMVTFVPDQSQHIGFNYVKIWVNAGEETTVPKCFYDVYMQSQRDSIAAFRNAEGVLASRGFISESTVGWRPNA